MKKTSDIMGCAIATLKEAKEATGTSFTEHDKQLIVGVLLCVIGELEDDPREIMSHGFTTELMIKKYL